MSGRGRYQTESKSYQTAPKPPPKQAEEGRSGTVLVRLWYSLPPLLGLLGDLRAVAGRRRACKTGSEQARAMLFPSSPTVLEGRAGAISGPTYPRPTRQAVFLLYGLGLSGRRGRGGPISGASRPDRGGSDAGAGARCSVSERGRATPCIDLARGFKAAKGERSEHFRETSW